ncbi:hypothetical protein BDW75DRAFT_221535, partial [Aspergillus navahoensis]
MNNTRNAVEKNKARKRHAPHLCKCIIWESPLSCPENRISWQLLRRLPIIIALGTGMIDLLADKVSGRSHKGDFDQTPYAAGTRIQTAHVVLTIEPAASAGERGGCVVVGV